MKAPWRRLPRTLRRRIQVRRFRAPGLAFRGPAERASLNTLSRFREWEIIAFPERRASVWLRRGARRRGRGRGACPASVCASSRRRTPRTGMPRGFMASRSIFSWVVEPTRLSIDTSDPQLGVECRVPVDHGGDGAGHRPGVDDEHDGRVEQLGDVGGRGELPAPLLPSKRPITPSTTAMSAPCAPWAKSGPMSSGPERKASRLRPGRPAARVWYEGSIKSGPTLKGATRGPCGERGHQARGDGGLSDSRVGASDDYAGGVYHSMPFWPR